MLAQRGERADSLRSQPVGGTESVHFVKLPTKARRVVARGHSQAQHGGSGGMLLGRPGDSLFWPCPCVTAKNLGLGIQNSERARSPSSLGSH